MHVAITHIGRLARSSRHHATAMLVASALPGRLLAIGLLVTAAAFVLGLTIGDLLAPESEAVLAAPFRWRLSAVR